MATENNNAIYLEADEDITSAIDKLTKAEGETIQVVAAKRSTLLQSVINLRLLKKAAADSKKKLVLITTDHVATNLAARIGVAVASKVGETPKVPTAGTPAAEADDEIDGGTVGDEPAKAAPVAAAVAGTTPLSTPPAEPTRAPEVVQPTAPAAAAPKAAKPKGPRVPNVGQMQKRILWAGGGIVAIILLVFLSIFLTSAKVTLFAKADQVNANFSFTADPSATQSDVDSGVLSAQQLSNTKSLSAPVQATGTKDLGTKAGGTITITNSCYNPGTIPAGTVFTASNGLKFLSNSDVAVPDASTKLGVCNATSASVGVTAQQNGDNYNLAPTSYSVGAYPSSVSGKGGQMQGGTTKIAKVLTQGDVDKAKQAALDSDKSDASSKLAEKANDQQKALDITFQQNVTSVSSSPDVGAEAQNGTVTVQVTYSELAVQKSALSDLAKKAESRQLGEDKQIYDDGSGNLQLELVGKPTSSGAQQLKAKATAYAGTKIDTDTLAKQLKGKKYGDAVDTASRVEGVEKAEITIKPGWATGMPRIVKHIHITIQASTGSDD